MFALTAGGSSIPAPGRAASAPPGSACQAPAGSPQGARETGPGRGILALTVRDLACLRTSPEDLPARPGTSRFRWDPDDS